MVKLYTLKKFDGGMHFITLDDKTVQSLTKDGNRRVICKMNREVAFHCAILKKSEGGSFINVGLSICKKLKLELGSKVTATFQIDKTGYQFNMPEEFEEVLSTDLAASTIFHSLTEGNQRGLIYLVAQVKSSDKKIERALKIAEKIKNGITSPKIVLK